MTIPIRPRPSPGALQAQVDRVLPAYQAYLNDQAFAASLRSALIGTARHMIAWLTINGSDPATLDIRSVSNFLSHDCNCPVEFRSQPDAPFRRHAHRVLADWLEIGQTAVPPAIVTGGRLVEAFAGTLTAQGYRESTRHAYAGRCRHLIVWLYLQELKEQLDALRERHGAELEQWWHDQFGHSFDCLTQSEARYLERSPNAETIRNRLAAAKQEGDGRSTQGDGRNRSRAAVR